MVLAGQAQQARPLETAVGSAATVQLEQPNPTTLMVHMLLSMQLDLDLDVENGMGYNSGGVEGCTSRLLTSALYRWEPCVLNCIHR